MNAIVAVTGDWGIGCNGTQSVVIPEDRRRFKTLTEGCVVIAGRKTFEDFGRPLPNRKNIILTRDPNYRVDGAVIKHSADDVLEEISGEPRDKIFIIGGEEIYRLFLPMCSCAYITKIDAVPPSDTFFPNLDELPEWELIEQSPIKEWSVECGVWSERNAELYAQTSKDCIRYSFIFYVNNSVTKY